MKKRESVYKKVFRYLKREKYLAVIAILLSLISIAALGVAYYYMYVFLDSLVVKGQIDNATKYSILIVGLLAGSALVYIISLLITHFLGFRLETNLRKKGIDGLAESSFRFYDLNESGKIRKIIDDNASQTHGLVAHLIPDLTRAILTPFIIIALSFLVSVRVGVTMIILIFLSLILLKLMMGEKKFIKIYQEKLEDMATQTVEYVRGIQVIKIFKTTANSFKVLHKSIKEYAKTAYDYSISCKWPYVIYQWLFLGVMALFIPGLVIFTSYKSASPKLAVDLIMILFLGGMLFANYMKIMYVFMYAYLGDQAVDKLENIYNEMKKEKLSFGDKESFSNFDIEFKNVSFSYGENEIFNNLSFKLEENKTYALVGASGSGKSTLVKLLSGFYKANSGEILVGGKSLEEYQEEAIIKKISFVYQDVKLFKLSILENVWLANKKATKDEVLMALKLAKCEDFLEKLPNGYDTVIGKEGIQLSGGEAQRIAIARAILKDSKIVIFDEASAAIDPDNEYQIQEAFKNLMKDKTVIMIAHRLSSIKDVDEIIVLDKGKIIERGSHEDLIQTKNLYFNLQKLYSEANDWRLAK